MRARVADDAVVRAMRSDVGADAPERTRPDPQRRTAGRGPRDRAHASSAATASASSRRDRQCTTTSNPSARRTQGDRATDAAAGAGDEDGCAHRRVRLAGWQAGRWSAERNGQQRARSQPAQHLRASGQSPSPPVAQPHRHTAHSFATISRRRSGFSDERIGFVPRVAREDRADHPAHVRRVASSRT